MAGHAESRPGPCWACLATGRLAAGKRKTERADTLINLNATVSIRRPVSEVYEFMRTVENRRRWQNGTLDSARIPTGSVGVGAAFRVLGHLLGRRAVATFQVTDDDANKRYGYRSLSGPLVSKTLYTFTTAAGGTHVAMSMHVIADRSFSVREEDLERKLGGLVNEDLTRLKGLLEAV